MTVKDPAILQRPGVRRGLGEIAEALFGDATRTRRAASLIKAGMPTDEIGRERIGYDDVTREWFDRRQRRALEKE